MRNKSGYSIGFIVVLLVGLFLRIFLLFDTRIFGDELDTQSLLQQSAEAFFTRYQNDPHPPLYFALIYLWSRINTSIYFLKSFSLIISLFQLWAVFGFLRDYFKDVNKAKLGMMFFALNPNVIYFSTLIRMYMLFLFFSTITIWATYACLRKIIIDFNAQFQEKNPDTTSQEKIQPIKKDHWWSLTQHPFRAFFLWNCLNLYTHYFALFLILYECSLIFIIEFRLLHQSGFTKTPSKQARHSIKKQFIRNLVFCIIPIPLLGFWIFRTWDYLSATEPAFFHFPPQLTLTEYLSGCLNFLSGLWTVDDLFMLLINIVAMILYCFTIIFSLYQQNNTYINSRQSSLIDKNKLSIYWANYALVFSLVGLVFLFLVGDLYLAAYGSKYFCYFLIINSPCWVEYFNVRPAELNKKKWLFHQWLLYIFFILLILLSLNLSHSYLVLIGR